VIAEERGRCQRGRVIELSACSNARKQFASFSGAMLPVLEPRGARLRARVVRERELHRAPPVNLMHADQGTTAWRMRVRIREKPRGIGARRRLRERCPSRRSAPSMSDAISSDVKRLVGIRLDVEAAASIFDRARMFVSTSTSPANPRGALQTRVHRLGPIPPVMASGRSAIGSIDDRDIRHVYECAYGRPTLQKAPPLYSVWMLDLRRTHAC